MLRKVGVFAAHVAGFFIGKVFDALLGNKMEFNPKALILIALINENV
jgi:hypothetical protein